MHPHVQMQEVVVWMPVLVVGWCRAGDAVTNSMSNEGDDIEQEIGADVEFDMVKRVI